MNDAQNRPEPEPSEDARDDPESPAGNASPTGTSARTPAVPDAAPGALPSAPAGDYTEQGVPTLDYVRDRVESRHATAVGAVELAEDSDQGRSIDEQLAERDEAGRKRLDEISRSLGRDTDG